MQIKRALVQNDTLSTVKTVRGLKQKESRKESQTLHQESLAVDYPIIPALIIQGNQKDKCLQSHFKINIP